MLMNVFDYITKAMTLKSKLFCAISFLANGSHATIATLILAGLRIPVPISENHGKLIMNSHHDGWKDTHYGHRSPSPVL